MVDCCFKFRTIFNFSIMLFTPNVSLHRGRCSNKVGRNVVKCFSYQGCSRLLSRLKSQVDQVLAHTRNSLVCLVSGL